MIHMYTMYMYDVYVTCKAKRILSNFSHLPLK